MAVLVHGLLDPAWFWILALMALLSVTLIAVLVYGLRKAYGKTRNTSLEELNTDQRPGPDSRVE